MLASSLRTVHTGDAHKTECKTRCGLRQGIGISGENVTAKARRLASHAEWGKERKRTQGATVHDLLDRLWIAHHRLQLGIAVDHLLHQLRILRHLLHHLRYHRVVKHLHHRVRIVRQVAHACCPSEWVRAHAAAGPARTAHTLGVRSLWIELKQVTVKNN